MLSVLFCLNTHTHLIHIYTSIPQVDFYVDVGRMVIGEEANDCLSDGHTYDGPTNEKVTHSFVLL